MSRIALVVLSQRSWQSLCAMLLLCSVANAQVPGPPRLTIVSAASYESQAVAPNSIVTLFGNALSLHTHVAETPPLPLQLGGTRVTLKDARNVEHAAALFFVSPTQINAPLAAFCYRITMDTCAVLAASSLIRRDRASGPRWLRLNNLV
jgi:hypothetical protein